MAGAAWVPGHAGPAGCQHGRRLRSGVPGPANARLPSCPRRACAGGLCCDLLLRHFMQQLRCISASTCKCFNCCSSCIMPHQSQLLQGIPANGQYGPQPVPAGYTLQQVGAHAAACAPALLHACTAPCPLCALPVPSARPCHMPGHNLYGAQQHHIACCEDLRSNIDCVTACRPQCLGRWIPLSLWRLPPVSSTILLLACLSASKCIKQAVYCFMLVPWGAVTRRAKREDSGLLRRWTCIARGATLHRPCLSSLHCEVHIGLTCTLCVAVCSSPACAAPAARSASSTG